VGDRAATWKCWSPPAKNDVYLACRELRGTLKTSLHESGRWHVAYSAKFFDENVPVEHRYDDGRFVEKWARPAVMAPGVTLAYRIVTSGMSCTTKETLPKSVHVVPAPIAAGRAVEFDIILVDHPTVDADGWPGKNQGTRLVGSYGLGDGASVFVVCWEIAMPTLPSVRGSPKFYQGKGAADLERANLRALAFGEEPDGSRVIYDCAITYTPSGPG